MNKARITYRFDEAGRRVPDRRASGWDRLEGPDREWEAAGEPGYDADRRPKAGRDEERVPRGSVIPLDTGEYRVVREDEAYAPPQGRRYPQEQRSETVGDLPAPRDYREYRERDSRPTGFSRDTYESDAYEGEPYRQSSGYAPTESRRSRQEPEPPARDYRIVNPNQDYGAWSDDFEAETMRIEKMIRRTGDGPGRPSDKPTGERVRIESREVDRYASGGGYPPAGDRGAEGYGGGWRDREREGRLPEYREERTGRREAAGRFSGSYPYDDERDTTRHVPVIDGPLLEDNGGGGGGIIRFGRSPWLRIIASATGAIITGVLLGYVVLTMFGGDGADKTLPAGTGAGNGNGTSVNATQGTTGTQTTVGSGNGQQAAAAGLVDVNLPARTYVLLQTGAFASPQGAETLKRELGTKGLAASIDSGELNVVYSGVASSRDDAQILRQRLEGRVEETAIKPQVMPTITSLRWGSSDGRQAEALFKQGGQLADMLTKLSVLQLDSGATRKLDDSSIQSVKQAHQSYTQAASSAAGEVPSAQSALFQQMGQGLSAAVQSLEEYNKNPSASLMWQAQNGIVQYLLAERSLLAALKG